MFNQKKDKEKALPRQEKTPEDFDITIKSLASDKHPDQNEDATIQMNDKKIFGVLDGMGGHAAGNVASEEAKNYISETLQNLPEELSLELTQKELEKVLFGANDKLLQLAKENPALKGMGTTASIVKIWEGAQGEKKAVIANIGDSRVYVHRANGQLDQVTLDDNIINKEVKDEKQAKIIQDKLNNVIEPNTLTDKEKMLFKHRNEISQALGIRWIKPRMFTVDIHEGEKLIVTSDGIHDNLTDKEIARILNAAPDSQSAVENLTDASRNRSREQHPRAKADDMSAIVIEIPSSIDSKKAEQLPSQKPIENQEEFQLRKGDIVRIKRSSGDIESGWEIVGFKLKTGNVIVQKSEKGEILEKQIPQTELKNLNPPEKKISISEAKDFMELFKTLESTGGLQGSEKFYEVEELKQLVNQVRAGELPLDIITKTDGLRQRVSELMKIEELKKNI